MDMTIGGAVDAASLLKGGTYKRLTNLIAKKNSGQKLTKAESEWYNKTMDKIKSENAGKREVKNAAKAQTDYEGTGINVTKPAGINTSPEAINSNNAKVYNSDKGGTANGKEIRQVGQGTVSADGVREYQERKCRTQRKLREFAGSKEKTYVMYKPHVGSV